MTAVASEGWRKSSYSTYNGDCAEVWRKSSRCQNGECTEVAACGDGVLVRDSKLGDASPVLSFGAGAWREFLAGVKAELQPAS